MSKFKFKSKVEKLKIFRYSDDFIGSKDTAGPHIEIFSNRELYIDGCRGILEYNEVYVKIRIKNGMIVVSGSEMGIPTFERTTITVKGKIQNIEFCIG